MKSPEQSTINSDKNNFKQEKSFNKDPDLRYIIDTLKLLKTEKGVDGKDVNWKHLNERIGDYDNLMDLSQKIKNVMTDYVSNRIIGLKDAIPVIDDIPDDQLIEALVNNYFYVIDENIYEKRKEVLLTVMAQIVKRIENGIYKKLFSTCSTEDLEKVGLNEDLREITVGLLDIASKSNPLFVRHLAFSQLSPKVPEEATSTAIYHPEKKLYKTVASLFPHETEFIAGKLREISEKPGSWLHLPGGVEFQKFLLALSELYSESDPLKAENIQNKVIGLYEEFAKTDFPIIVIPAIEGYLKPPYLDPEMRVCVTNKETQEKEDKYRQLQITMSDSLNMIGCEDFKEEVSGKTLKNLIAISSNGVNLHYPIEAQGAPTIMIYQNDLESSLGQKFFQYFGLIKNHVNFQFDNVEGERGLLKEIASEELVMHELSHSVFNDEEKLNKRWGPDNRLILDEVKAEILYRALIPDLAGAGKIEGDEKQNAVSLFVNSLRWLNDSSGNDDPYYLSAAYSLNRIVEENAVVLEKDGLEIRDIGLFYQINKQEAEKIVKLYKDESIDKKEISRWIKDNCRPTEKLIKILEFVKDKGL